MIIPQTEIEVNPEIEVNQVDYEYNFFDIIHWLK